MSHMTGHRTPSLMGSRQSVYSHSSSVVRSTRTGPKSHKFGKSMREKWWQKPIMKSAIYTDLQRGAWHIAFYTLVSFSVKSLSSSLFHTIFCQITKICFIIPVLVDLDDFHIGI